VEIGVEPTLIKGVAGQFDVIVDRAVVFSKTVEKRFPQDTELIETIKKLMVLRR
jgi:predicted Rdx family selenoprotein